MTLKDKIKSFTAEAIRELYGIETAMLPVEYPDQKQFGDYATTAAMSLAKQLKKNPREIAGALAEYMKKKPEFRKIEVAGPGFINFFLSDEFLHGELTQILTDTDFGKSESLKGKKILLEFVSANPTGPLHIGHGRWAAIGDSMAKILDFAGAKVTTEFYINDAGNQINLLRQSVEAVKKGEAIPENGYHGAYIKDVAAMEGDPAANLLELQKKTLKDFRTHFDGYFSEKSLHDSGYVKDTLEYLHHCGHSYDQEGAFWFKTTDFGDDKDRVLVKSDGEFTYFAVDIAYHRNKVNRDFDTLYTVLGADHHGYVKRLEAAVKVCAEEIKKNIELKVIIGQLVSLYRNGEPVRMSKRTGDMVTLEEVMEEIGVDATRYFLVMRKADTAFDFDLEVAKRKSDDNPVFYVQYAHARITGILRNATDDFSQAPDKVIDSEEARDLVLALIKFPEIVAESAASLEPHRLPLYLENVARTFHYFYNHHRVITDDKDTTRRRMQLIFAAKRVINNGLMLIGVSSPERM